MPKGSVILHDFLVMVGDLIFALIFILWLLNMGVGMASYFQFSNPNYIQNALAGFLSTAALTPGNVSIDYEITPVPINLTLGGNTVSVSIQKGKETWYPWTETMRGGRIIFENPKPAVPYFHDKTTDVDITPATGLVFDETSDKAIVVTKSDKIMIGVHQ